MIHTVLLNAVAMITILKSSQLKSKPCYFIILVQSINDLAVGIVSIIHLISGKWNRRNYKLREQVWRLSRQYCPHTILLHPFCTDIGKIHCHSSSLCLQNQCDKKETADLRWMQYRGDNCFVFSLFT
jgi:hypothetical protein